ncbi:hypothetical protein KM043_015273 [Ampulex compressa]|nr:hypothetical protein KM043_015273 [Ampulex compressa]
MEGSSVMDGSAWRSAKEEKRRHGPTSGSSVETGVTKKGQHISPSVHGRARGPSSAAWSLKPPSAPYAVKAAPRAHTRATPAPPPAAAAPSTPPPPLRRAYFERDGRHRGSDEDGGRGSERQGSANGGERIRIARGTPHHARTPHPSTAHLFSQLFLCIASNAYGRWTVVAFGEFAVETVKYAYSKVYSNSELARKMEG